MPQVKASCSSGICITKCVNYHSLILEVGEIKFIGMIVPYILGNSDRRHFMCSRLHPLISYDTLNIQDILSQGVSVILARSVLILCSAINSRGSVGILRISQVYSLVALVLRVRFQRKSVSLSFMYSQMSNLIHYCTMGSPLNKGRGLQGSRRARFKPQRA